MGWRADATVPAYPSVEPRPPRFGQVMPGWSRTGWATECERRARCCIHADLAEIWLEWAFVVRLQNGRGTQEPRPIAVGVP